MPNLRYACALQRPEYRSFDFAQDDGGVLDRALRLDRDNLDDNTKAHSGEDRSSNIRIGFLRAGK